MLMQKFPEFFFLNNHFIASKYFPLLPMTIFQINHVLYHASPSQLWLVDFQHARSCWVIYCQNFYGTPSEDQTHDSVAMLNQTSFDNHYLNGSIPISTWGIFHYLQLAETTEQTKTATWSHLKPTGLKNILQLEEHPITAPWSFAAFDTQGQALLYNKNQQSIICFFLGGGFHSNEFVHINLEQYSISLSVLQFPRFRLFEHEKKNWNH